MKLNSRGIIVETLLYYVIAGLVLFFVPNPVSNAVGVGVRPNKTIQTNSTETKVDFLRKDVLGRPVAEPDGSYLIGTTTKNKTSDLDHRDNVGLLDQFKALPGLFIALILLAIFGFPPAVGAVKVFWAKYSDWKERHQELQSESARVVKSVDAALDYWDAQINASKIAMDTATQTAATLSDPNLLAAQRVMIEQYRAVMNALIDTKKGFLSTMKNKQDESTGDAVKMLRKVVA